LIALLEKRFAMVEKKRNHKGFTSANRMYRPKRSRNLPAAANPSFDACLPSPRPGTILESVTSMRFGAILLGDSRGRKRCPSDAPKKEIWLSISAITAQSEAPRCANL
jgi:hypothetical protein